MNALEHQLDYPFGDTLPEGGTRFEVAPGVYWLRMPLPFALDHINLWLLRDRQDGKEGWTIIDCGINHEAIRGYWETIFANHLDGLPVLRVLVTHCHPDHVGLSNWLCEGGDEKRWNVRLWMSLGDYAFARMLVGGTGASNAGGEFAARHFERHGLTDPTSIEGIRNRKDYYSTLVPGVPSQYRRLMDGDVVAIGEHKWRVITGFGHAPEHVALYSEDANVLISGDMVLPRISTNVSVFDLEPEADSLTLYLDSLGKYEPLPADVLILPSHGRPFRGLHTRPPCGPAGRNVGCVQGRAAIGTRHRQCHLQAPVRCAPDDLRDGRGARPPACAVASRRTGARNRRGRYRSIPRNCITAQPVLSTGADHG